MIELRLNCELLELSHQGKTSQNVSVFKRRFICSAVDCYSFVSIARSMGKPKKGSRTGVGQIPSPRGRLHPADSHKEDASKQDEPVTDTVMQVLGRRIRAARKKMQKVSMIESLREQGQDLQEDQVSPFLAH